MAPLSQDTSEQPQDTSDHRVAADAAGDRLELTDVTGLPSPAVRRRPALVPRGRLRARPTSARWFPVTYC